MEPYFSEIAAFDQIGKLQEGFFFFFPLYLLQFKGLQLKTILTPKKCQLSGVVYSDPTAAEPHLPGGSQVLHEALKKQVEGERRIPSETGLTAAPGGSDALSSPGEGLTDRHFSTRAPRKGICYFLPPPAPRNLYTGISLVARWLRTRFAVEAAPFPRALELGGVAAAGVSLTPT